MAETTGLVQTLSIGATFACAWIGPQANNAELLVVTSDGTPADASFAGTLIETLSAAQTNFRAVAAIHADNDSKITALRIDPV